jgi:all-trans-retinol 13,14-reductase
MTYDYVIIGAGVSGMTTAVILAKHGFHVSLVEKDHQMAPLLRGFFRKGIFFDTGFHYTGGMGDGGILDRFFQYLGIADCIRKRPYQKDRFDIIRCLSPAFDFYFPYGEDRVRERFYLEFPNEKAAIDTYFHSINQSYLSYPYMNLDIPMEFGFGLQNFHQQSLQQVLDRLTDNERLKRVLSIHCFLYGASPDEIPFSSHACIVGPYYESVHGIDGGGRSIVKAFERELKRLGVDFYGSHGAEKVLFDSNKNLVGVRLTDGSDILCQGCISTIHPNKMLDLVPPFLFRPSYLKKLKTLEDSTSAFILYVICDTNSKALSGTNFILVPDLNWRNFSDQKDILKRPLFISMVHQKKKDHPVVGYTAICPSHKDDGVDQWHRSYRGKRPGAYKEWKMKIADALLAHIHANCPELGKQALYSECATPLTLKDHTNSNTGALYGVKHKVGQFNPLFITRSKDFFIAGQAVTAPGVLGSMVSAFLVCGHIIGHQQLRNELQAYP